MKFVAVLVLLACLAVASARFVHKKRGKELFTQEHVEDSIRGFLHRLFDDTPCVEKDGECSTVTDCCAPLEGETVLCTKFCPPEEACKHVCKY